jgi:hypothetical protein
MKLDSKHIDIANRKIDFTCLPRRPLWVTLRCPIQMISPPFFSCRRSRNGSYPLVPCGMPDSISGLRAPTEKDGVTTEHFMTMTPRQAIDAGLGNDRARIGSWLREVSASSFSHCAKCLVFQERLSGGVPVLAGWIRCRLCFLDLRHFHLTKVRIRTMASSRGTLAYH